MFKLVKNNIRGMRKELGENGAERCNEWKYADGLAFYMHSWNSRLATSCELSSDVIFETAPSRRQVGRCLAATER